MFEALRSSIDGPVLIRGDEGFDEAAKVWNATVERRPAAIVRPSTTAGVQAVVRFAADNDVLLAVRGGGHSISGLSTCDEGLVLDLSGMQQVSVDAERRIAIAAGGAHVAHVDTASQAHGLATTMGTVSHTGIGGLTLGGGFGRLTRQHGLSVDNLLELEVVLAEGSVVRCSERENDELFWGMRGAGANFGVATSFTFRLHHIGTDCAAALALYELEHARAALGALANFQQHAPDELVAIGALGDVPAVPPFPAEFHGRRMILIGCNHFGPAESAEKDIRELIQSAPAAWQFSARMPYLGLQQSADEKYRWGGRYYIKGGLMRELTEQAIDVSLECLATLPDSHSEIDFLPVGGAAARVPEDAMAYSGRGAQWFVAIDSTWNDPARDAERRDWCRSVYDAFEPMLMAANYVNAVEDSNQTTLRRTYGDTKFERLVALKRRYDPDNLFKLNNNIVP